MSLQAFKETDEKEAKVRDAFLPLLNLLGNDRDDFYEGSFETFPLGGVIYDLEASPLAGVIERDVFISSFFSIFSYFTKPGTFEFYLNVFRSIWGEDVVVEFTIPDPGHLQINIEALSTVTVFALARRVVDSVYVYDFLVDQEGDNILFQVSNGIKTQSEVDAFMKELTPEGVFVETTLVLT